MKTVDENSDHEALARAVEKALREDPNAVPEPGTWEPVAIVVTLRREDPEPWVMGSFWRRWCWRLLLRLRRIAA